MRLPPFVVLLFACGVHPDDAPNTAAPPPPQPRWVLPAALAQVGYDVELVRPDGRLLVAPPRADAAAGATISEVVVTPTGHIATQPWFDGPYPSAVGLAWADGDADGTEDVMLLVDDSPTAVLNTLDATNARVRRTVALDRQDVTGPARFTLFQRDADLLPEVLLVDHGDAAVFDDNGAEIVVAPGASDPPQLADTDLDGLTEVLMTDGRLLELPGLSLVRILPGAPWSILATADWTLDGVPDTLAIHNDPLPPRIDNRRTLIDGATGRPVWTRRDAFAVSRVVPYDADLDGAPEIVVIGDRDQMIVLDPRTGRARSGATSPEPWFATQVVTPWDHDGDGVESLVATGVLGTRLVDPLNGWGPIAPAPTPRTSMFAADLNGDGARELIGATRDLDPALQFSLDPQTGALRSSRAAPRLESTTNLAIDWDHDGDDEIASIGLSDATIHGLGGHSQTLRVSSRGAVVAREPRGEMLVFRGSSDVSAITPAGTAWTIQQAANALIAGDLDLDGIDEVILSTGAEILVLDAATGAIELATPGMFDDLDVISDGAKTRLVLTREDEDSECWELVGGVFQTQWTHLGMAWAFGTHAFGDHVFFDEGGFVRVEDMDGAVVVTIPLDIGDADSDLVPIPGGFVALERGGRLSAWDVP